MRNDTAKTVECEQAHACTQGRVKVGVVRVLGLRRGLRIVLDEGEFWSEVLRRGLRTGLGKVSQDSKQAINPLQT
jgi:hypothetical protein